MFPAQFQGVSAKVFGVEGCVKGVSRVCQGCFKGVLRVLQMSSRGCFDCV